MCYIILHWWQRGLKDPIFVNIPRIKSVHLHKGQGKPMGNTPKTPAKPSKGRFNWRPCKFVNLPESSSSIHTRSHSESWKPRKQVRMSLLNCHFLFSQVYYPALHVDPCKRINSSINIGIVNHLHTSINIWKLQNCMHINKIYNI